MIRWFLVLFAAIMLHARAACHPLDPLTADELTRTQSLIRAVWPNALFVTVALLEPPKADVISWTPGTPFARRANVVLMDSGKSYEATVDLTSGTLIRRKTLLDQQPLQTDREYKAISELVRSDIHWQKAIRLRGIDNFDQIFLNIWTYGNERGHGSPHRRLMRVLSVFKGAQTNVYGPPIEGLEVIVQCEPLKILEIIDTGVRAVGPDSTDIFDPQVLGARESVLKPLEVKQPDGVSYSVQGNEISWDNWRFRYSFHPRDGLVLHQVRYRDGGSDRSILYRASISEMFVPYGSGDRTWFWRAAIDEGEYGLGRLASPLEVGKTAPPHATLLPVLLANEEGEGVELPARIALYERHGGNLWSHWDYDAGVVGRRQRELVIGFIATIGNYDYGLNWIFRQDGSLEFQAELTGILLTQGVDGDHCQNCDEDLKPGKRRLRADERYGTLVARNVVAVNHQHFINVRLDFDIDGPNNAVKEINAVRESKWKNKHGNAFIAEQTVFGREREARRNLDLASNRHWVFFNPNTRTELGHFPGYAIELANGAFPFMSASRLPRKISGFADHQLFVTHYAPAELYAAGDYPNQAVKSHGVVSYGADNQSILNKDIVAWITVGLTHIPRPEEYPVMPSARAGFKLLPKAFFNRNPALSVPDGN